MIDTIIGTKIDQSQTFSKGGKRLTITRVQTGPLYIVGLKTVEKHGYNAVQLGFGNRKIKRTKKPLLGQLKKAGLEKNPPFFLHEIKFNGDIKEALAKKKEEVQESEADTKEEEKSQDMQKNTLTIGDKVRIDEVLNPGDAVQVTGISKGKGFQGVVKRHGFAGGPRTHGQSDRERAPGSIGQTTTPGRVYKGKRMAGRMGGEKITVKNLKVFKIDKKRNILTLTGLVPGGRNTILIISKTNFRK